MGGLRRYLPITYWTSLVGSLALIGFPGFSGFFSKDALIEAVGLSTIAGSGYAYGLPADGRFRHGLVLLPHVLSRVSRQRAAGRGCAPSSARVAVGDHRPAGAAGHTVAGHRLADHRAGALWRVFRLAIHVVAESHDVLARAGRGIPWSRGFPAAWPDGLPVLLSLAGVASAWYLYLVRTRRFRRQIRQALNRPYIRCSSTSTTSTSSTKRYSLAALAPSGNVCGAQVTWRSSTGSMVNGSARLVGWFAGRRSSCADRVSLSLCIRHDHRSVRACWVGC